jgi:hypothetical protein
MTVLEDVKTYMQYKFSKTKKLALRHYRHPNFLIFIFAFLSAFWIGQGNFWLALGCFIFSVAYFIYCDMLTGEWKYWHRQKRLKELKKNVKQTEITRGQ